MHSKVAPSELSHLGHWQVCKTHARTEKKRNFLLSYCIICVIALVLDMFFCDAKINMLGCGKLIICYGHFSVEIGACERNFILF